MPASVKFSRISEFGKRDETDDLTTEFELSHFLEKVNYTPQIQKSVCEKGRVML